jgi:hypothetical protein
MLYTARQLAELLKSTGGNGPIVLPYRARLTPLAMDWVRTKKIAIGYSESPQTKSATPAAAQAPAPVTGEYLWWSDGPCGPAKAAIAMEARQSPLRELDIQAGPDALVAAIKTIAAAIKDGKAAGGLLLLQTSGSAVILANRCSSLRAIVGSSLETVDQGVNQLAANLVIIEQCRWSLPQVRNLVARFLRGKRQLSEDAQRQLTELSKCG